MCSQTCASYLDIVILFIKWKTGCISSYKSSESHFMKSWSLFKYILTHQNCSTSPWTTCIWEHHWPHKSLTDRHTMCSITMATECNASPPLGALNFITRPEGCQAQGVAGLYQSIQIQLTGRPTILTGCICFMGYLTLEGGQMLIFLMWHISETIKRKFWRGTALLYAVGELPACILSVTVTIYKL